VRVGNGLVLADQAAQFLRDGQHAGFERRVFGGRQGGALGGGRCSAADADDDGEGQHRRAPGAREVSFAH
jgi:hypothetical protein